MRLYTNEEYGYPPERELSDEQRTVPPKMVSDMTAKLEEEFIRKGQTVHPPLDWAEGHTPPPTVGYFVMPDTGCGPNNELAYFTDDFIPRNMTGQEQRETMLFLHGLPPDTTDEAAGLYCFGRTAQWEKMRQESQDRMQRFLFILAIGIPTVLALTYLLVLR